MKKVLYIGWIALIACACGTTNDLPLDDAYYWPDNRTVPVAATPVETSQPSEVSGSSKSSTLEYISVQDTTVTVRIKR